VTPLESSIDR